MDVKVKIFRTQKNGNIADEYEDAYQPEKEGEYNNEIFYAAMADGASEGYLSDQWADILVKQVYNGHIENGNLINLIEEAQAEWEKFLKDYLDKRQAENRPIQWYEEPGLENGAFSTFIGLTIVDGPDATGKTWFASAIGDTCLFQIRQAELFACFPIHKAESFNSWPALISSNAQHNLKLAENIQGQDGLWEINDLFFIMSDAISAWFLKEYEINRQPWLLLQELTTKSEDEFLNWVGELREANEIRNDDVSLMSLLIS